MLLRTSTLLTVACLVGSALSADTTSSSSSTATTTTSTSTANKPTKTTSTAPPACTASSSTGTGAFFDLRPDIAYPADQAKAHKGAATADYKARGWDYGRNFTLNICGAVIDPVKDVVGLDKDLWRNVSAYYVSGKETFSIGQQSMNLTTRGRKLVLQYFGGSPCKSSSSSSSSSSGKLKRAVGGGSSVHRGAAYSKYSDDEEEIVPTSDEQKRPGEEDKKTDGKAGGVERRKSTTISFLCDRDQLTGPAALSFVGTDPDECAYFFEARSPHACPAAEPHKPGSVGPGSVFAIIFVIAVLVYFGGGIFYQRTVAHARGWRQLPNYSLWAGIWIFISDAFIILTSSCARFMPRRRGYHYLSSSPNGRRNSREDENRLIDQLDEEWDD